MCTALPGLHAAALRLLGCSLRAAGGGTVPLHAPAARLFAGQLRQLAAGSPELMPWTVGSRMGSRLFLLLCIQSQAGTDMVTCFCNNTKSTLLQRRCKTAAVTLDPHGTTHH